MKFSDFFDSYDLKARWCPAALVLLPAVITVYGEFPSITTSPVLAVGSGAVSFALLYLASMIVRELGLQAQTRLWRKWGGAPSTRFLRARDRRFSEANKNLIRQKILQQFQLDLSSPEIERGNALAADQAIDQAFKRVREFLRGRHKFGLVDKHNAEYGFVRNLYGARWILLSLCFVGAVLAMAGNGHALTLGAAGVLDLVIAVVWIPIGFWLLPKMIKRNAEDYADKAWMSFLEVTKQEMQ